MTIGTLDIEDGHPPQEKLKEKYATFVIIVFINYKV